MVKARYINRNENKKSAEEVWERGAQKSIWTWDLSISNRTTAKSADWRENIIRVTKIEMGAACSTPRKWEMYVRISVRKPEGIELFRRSRYRCEDNIKIDDREVGSDTMEAQNSLQFPVFCDAFLYHKRRGIYWLAEQVWAYKGVWSVELIMVY
jgi:hypothetical protein